MTQQTKVFELPSLHVATDFDKQSVSHELPISLDQSVPQAVALIDGAVRAPHRLARVVRPSGLLGLSIVPTTEELTVQVDLRVDALSTRMWHDHLIGTRAKMKRNDDKDAEVELPDVSGRHRSLRITAQGRVVAGAVLGHRPLDGEASSDRVVFQVTPDQIGEDGLLMIGLESTPADERAWSIGAAMEDGAVGVAIARVHLRLGAEPVKPRIAVGRRDDAGALVLGESGVFVVNPGSPDRDSRVEVAVRGVGGDRLRGRRARVKHPGRAVRELAQDRTVDRTHGIAMSVLTLDGAEVPGARVDGPVLELPAGVGPVLVRLQKSTPGGAPSLVDWAVTVR